MTHPELQAPHSRNRLTVVAMLVALAVVVAATGVHFAAVAASRRAQGPGELPARAAAARLAATLEPWNADLARRSRVLRQWELGKRMLDAGDYNGAVDELTQAYAGDVGNADLLALFKRAQEMQALATNRKAHLQHGHEGPGGTLRPQDIER